MISLPTEVWLKIFGYLDFDTVQKEATLVCREWFSMIRNNNILSGHMVLRTPSDIWAYAMSLEKNSSDSFSVAKAADILDSSRWQTGDALRRQGP